MHRRETSDSWILLDTAGWPTFRRIKDHQIQIYFVLGIDFPGSEFGVESEKINPKESSAIFHGKK